MLIFRTNPRWSTIFNRYNRILKLGLVVIDCCRLLLLLIEARRYIGDTLIWERRFATAWWWCKIIFEMKKMNTKKEFIIEMAGVFTVFSSLFISISCYIFFNRINDNFKRHNLARSYGETGINFQLILAFDRFWLASPFVIINLINIFFLNENSF